VEGDALDVETLTALFELCGPVRRAHGAQIRQRPFGRQGTQDFGHCGTQEGGFTWLSSWFGRCASRICLRRQSTGASRNGLLGDGLGWNRSRIAWTVRCEAAHSPGAGGSESGKHFAPCTEGEDGLVLVNGRRHGLAGSREREQPSGCRAWTPSVTCVLALIHRGGDEGDESMQRESCRVAEWEIPLVEVVSKHALAISAVR
jgi:hypothetical protein